MKFACTYIRIEIIQPLVNEYKSILVFYIVSVLLFILLFISILPQLS